MAELFSRELNGRFAADPEVLTAVARKELRQKFLQADLGITGVECFLERGDRSADSSDFWRARRRARGGGLLRGLRLILGVTQ